MADQKTIEWTPEKLSAFRAAYNKAVEAKESTFTFEGDPFVLGYAGYLIEFLDKEFGS